MTQRGLYNSANVVIDQLSYTYQPGSNKLARVTDAAIATTGLGDFNNGTNSGDDYAYDFNGNLTKDENKKISAITYNILNLPETITVSPPSGGGVEGAERLRTFMMPRVISCRRKYKKVAL